MARADTVSDLDDILCLAPAFLVSITGAGVVLIPQLTEIAVRRSPRGAVPLIAELSRTERRPVGALIGEVVEQTGADHATLVRFVEALKSAGLVSNEPAVARFAAITAPDGRVAAAPANATLTLVKPASLLVEVGHYLWFDQDGALRARLLPAEVVALTALAVPRSLDAAFDAHRKGTRPRLDEKSFAQFVGTMLEAGLVRIGGGDAFPQAASETPRLASPRDIVQERVAQAVETHQSERAQHSGARVPVVPVNADHGVAPLSLALLMAHASEFEQQRLRERYDFVPEFLTDETRLLERSGEPSIFIFSNYVWNVDENLTLSALVKATNPTNITVHGGPSTPKYEGDAEEFFARYPHVDVAVHGEGEMTFTEMLARARRRAAGDSRGAG